jgi:hypothetical protein
MTVLNRKVIMSDTMVMLEQLLVSAEVARNIEAEAQRKAKIIEVQRKAMDRANREWR